ncbi:uncharacterized protein EKO05_0010242 [Ascochyta rabiei]|uniref:Uncharacterized protein n=1 Tax=Didymella rabiei TaxID=5454 RepID=A0A162WKW8_DIDRA|nr:uncharacterized protein EKO05_0010242 [Ascochyta rabiei]KZM19091.1 hypothetical protein ST47_g9777 [Ascochyta rabiei]UPX19995.1 hypothetical protein EKO05_0010242 [Ascochyta rabiei]
MSPSQGQKRTADYSPTTSTHAAHSLPDTTTPQLLRRHQHRRRNIATLAWGPEAPPHPTRRTTQTPSTPTPTPPTPHFNIYKSLLRHPNLFFPLTLRLPYATIIALYAIDKEFHYRLNLYSVSLMHDYARYHAPLASHVFSWILFPELCISDPMLRPMDGRAWLARDVPGFRWVGMVLHRQRVVRGVLSCLAAEGHRVPRAAEGVLAKFWCVMECCTAAVRGAFLRDTSIWSDGEILVFQLLLLKLDMRFSDPVLGNGIGELAHLLLTQKGLGLLYDVLRGRVEMDYDVVTDIVVRTYLSEDLDTDTHTWLDDELDNGVPEEEWGLLCREGWHMNGERMESAVDMVIMEGMRRGLDVQKYYLEFVTYGFVDGDGKNIPVPRMLRRRNGTGVVEIGWPSEQTKRSALAQLGRLAGIPSADAMGVDA